MVTTLQWPLQLYKGLSKIIKMFVCFCFLLNSNVRVKTILLGKIGDGGEITEVLTFLYFVAYLTDIK